MIVLQVSLLGIQFQWTADTQAALTNAKTDKTIMSKNMKKVGMPFTVGWLATGFDGSEPVTTPL